MDEIRTSVQEARIRAVKRRLSNRMKVKVSRLAAHLNQGKDHLLEELLFAAAADSIRRAIPGNGTGERDEALWAILDDHLRDDASLKRFELKFLRYHVRHRQRMVRPTWASILVGRLSAETCALWVRMERQSGEKIRFPINLREIVYLPDDAFRIMEEHLLRSMLREREAAQMRARTN